MSTAPGTNEVIKARASAGGKRRVFAIPGQGVVQAVLVDMRIWFDVEKKVKENGKEVIKKQDEIQFVYQLKDTITLEDLEAAAEAAGVSLTDDDRKQVGQRFLVFSRRFNFKLSYSTAKKKTDTTAHVTGIRGGAVPDEEIENYNWAELLNRNVELVIIHNPVDEKVFPNIAGVKPWDTRNGTRPFIEPESYVRFKDRKKAEADVEAEDDNE